MGLCVFNSIERAEKARRGESDPNPGSPYGVPMTPEVGVACVSMFGAWLGLLAIHRITGMFGRALWVPLGAAAIVALVVTLIVVVVEFGTLPVPTWKQLGITIVSLAVGGMLAVPMAKDHW